MNLHGIKFKIIIYVGILLILSLSASSLINDITFKSNAENLTEEAISQQSKYFVETIEKTIANMQVAGNALAASGAMVYENYKINPTMNYREILIKYLNDYLRTDKNAAGYGIWFDKDIFENDPFVGPYVYWDNNTPVSTLDYEDPEYNFQASEWYTQTLPLNWDRSKPRDGYYITAPFYDDVLKQTFITMGRTIVDYNGRIIGMISNDWTLDFLNILLSEVQIT